MQHQERTHTQASPDALFAAEYAKPSAEPDWRPKRPCRLGPCLWPAPCRWSEARRGPLEAVVEKPRCAPQRALTRAHARSRHQNVQRADSHHTQGGVDAAHVQRSHDVAPTHLLYDVALRALGLEDLGTLRASRRRGGGWGVSERGTRTGERVEMRCDASRRIIALACQHGPSRRHP